MSMCKKIISVFLAVVSVVLMCSVGITANAVEYNSTDTGKLTVHLNAAYDASAGRTPVYGMQSDGNFLGGGVSTARVYFKYGDVNMDGDINTVDATFIYGYLGHIYELTSQQVILADANGDGKITDEDATCIQCYAVGLKDQAGRCGQNSTVRIGGTYPVSGVTISVYKIDGVNNYFSKMGTALPKAEDVNVVNSVLVASATTNAKGIAVIENLPRAIYYCKITKVAKGVVLTKTMTPFVFSVPSSNAEYTTSAVTGWNYDLHAYPKVEINYGKVTLKKIDSATKKGLPGATFTLYYSTDKKNTWSVLTENLKTGDNGELTVKDLAIGDYKFVETSTSDDSYILNPSVGYEFSMTTEGLKNCDYADGNDIIVSNDTVNIHKYVLDNVDESAATLKKFTNAVEGIDTTQAMYKDTYWSIHVTVPSDIKDLDTFDVIDWYDDKYLLLNPQYCVVSGVDANGNKSVMSATSYATSRLTDIDKSEHPFNGMTEPPLVTPAALKWAFKPAKLSGYKEIVIYVFTTLRTGMPLATDVPNTATIDYTNVIGTDSTHRKQAETPTVHTGGVKILKLAAATGKPLRGVKFRIYATKEDALAGANYYRTVTTDANGVATFQGIPYGGFSTNETDKVKNGSKNGSSKYWVMEVAPPSGYLPMKEPIEVTVNANSHNTDTDNTVTILNYKSPVLPNAGSITAIVLAGIAFVFIGIGMFIVIKRKKRS